SPGALLPSPSGLTAGAKPPTEVGAAAARAPTVTAPRSPEGDLNKAPGESANPGNPGCDAVEPAVLRIPRARPPEPDRGIVQAGCSSCGGDLPGPPPPAPGNGLC